MKMQTFFLIMILFFSFFPYLNFGVTNYLTTQGELTYYYLIFTVIGLGFNIKYFFELVKKKYFYLIITPLFLDILFNLATNDIKNLLKTTSILLLTFYFLSIRFSYQEINLLRKVFLSFLLIHILFTFINYFIPTPFWVHWINYGPLRGNIDQYLQMTSNIGKYVRGLNTEPGSNIFILLLLLNLYLFFLFLSLDKHKIKHVIIFASFYSLIQILSIKALRAFFLLPIFFFDILRGSARSKSSFLMLFGTLFIIFSTLLITLISEFKFDFEKMERAFEFISDPINFIKHDPSIQIHLAKFLGELSPSGFSIMFIYGHVFLLIYFLITIKMVLREKHFFPSPSFFYPVRNLLILSMYSILISTYHSPYAIEALLIPLSFYLHLRKRKI